MPVLPFDVYDADNHLYEPAEAFLRHLPKAYQREFYFAEVKGRTKLVINGQLSEYIPNPTFEAVASFPAARDRHVRGHDRRARCDDVRGCDLHARACRANAASDRRSRGNGHALYLVVAV